VLNRQQSKHQHFRFPSVRSHLAVGNVAQRKFSQHEKETESVYRRLDRHRDDDYFSFLSRIAFLTSGDTKTLLPTGISSSVRSVSHTVILHRLPVNLGSGIFRCVMLIWAVASSSFPSGRRTATVSVRWFQPRSFQPGGTEKSGDNINI